MVYNIIFDEEIEPKSVSKFLEDLNGAGEDEINFYFSTNGGNLSESYILSNALEENKDRITLIATGCIGSCGFDVYMNFNGKRKVLPGTYGIVHQSVLEVDIYADGNPRKWNQEFLKERKSVYKTTLETLKSWGLTKQQINLFKRGEDVYVSHEFFKSTERLK